MRAFVVVVFSFAFPGFWLTDAQSGLSLRRFGGVD